MKTLGRILVIVVAFALVMGATYFAVNTSSTTSNAPAFDHGGNFSPNSPRPEFHGERDGGGGSWIFGMIKNIGIVAVIVALIVLPKNFAQKKRQAIPIGINE